MTPNPLLIKATRDCIDYVTSYRLCYLAEHNHSERLYLLIGQVMPKIIGIKYKLE
ncbi:MAG: YgjP-like metallopeptidase domain-containing protein [Idiomarina sp.]